MAEISAELVFKVLKSLQRQVGTVEAGIGEIKAELSAVRGHMISMQQDIHNIYSILGRHDVRLERIDRRLEIANAPSL